ncbi:MAG: shikimate kinase [Fusobacteriaceae bacterium]|jgi:shikimate kinase|nr:shikimate kinase [Fusobacteriaceae bacterium]
MKSNLILIGFMGSGKSTVGKILAEKLEMKFLDTDLEIEKEQGRSVQDIFSEKGEEYFRKLENEMSKKLSTENNTIISTGGGIILNKENIEYLKKDGVVFFLDVAKKTLYKRLISSKGRPLLEGDELWSKINNVLGERLERYRSSADFIVKVGNEIPYETMEDIKKLYIEKA